jgi:hypothetical protein
MHWGCGPRPLFAGLVQRRWTPWSKPKHGLTIIIIKTITQYHFSVNNFQIIRQQLNRLLNALQTYLNDAAIKSKSTVKCHKCLVGKWFYFGNITQTYSEIWTTEIRKGKERRNRIRMFFLREGGVRLGLVVEGEDGRLGLALMMICLRLHIPFSNGVPS